MRFFGIINERINMKIKFLSLLTLVVLTIVANFAHAQYPKIPADVQKASDDMMAEARKLSDIAWEKA